MTRNPLPEHVRRQNLPKLIPQLSEADLTELVFNLWAAQIWGNKQYLVQQIISANGLDNLKLHLRRLWDTSAPVAKRYEGHPSEVRGIQNVLGR